MPAVFLKLKPLLLCVLGALLLMGICFYNGYPLHDGDTHSYLDTGFKNMFPLDRTPFYGQFIRLSSFWSSLWFTVFFECLILSWLLQRLITLLSGQKSNYFSLMCMAAIAALTCISWVSAVLMPDIFGGILFTAIILYLFDSDCSHLVRSFYVLILLVAVAMHNSHFLIVAVFASLLLLYSIYNKQRSGIKKSVVLIIVAIGFYLSMCTLNASHGKGFVFSPASKVFVMAKLATDGILDLYLNEQCDKKNLKLCSCKGQLPMYQWDFVWPPPTSPLSKLNLMDSCSEEFSLIIHDVFTNPKYIGLFIKKTAISGFRQMLDFQVHVPPGDDKDSWLSQRFNSYFEDEFKEYLTSKQNTNVLDPHDFNVVYNLFLILSSLWVFLLYSDTGNKQLYQIYCAILVYLFINALVTSTFTAFSFRFQYRIIWLLPATNAILILNYFYLKMQLKRGL
jgi:hypothetical protein